MYCHCYLAGFNDQNGAFSSLHWKTICIYVNNEEIHDLPIWFYCQPLLPPRPCFKHKKRFPWYLEIHCMKRNYSLVQLIIANNLIAFHGFRRHNSEFDSTVRRTTYSWLCCFWKRCLFSERQTFKHWQRGRFSESCFLFSVELKVPKIPILLKKSSFFLKSLTAVKKGGEDLAFYCTLQYNLRCALVPKARVVGRLPYYLAASQ